MSSSSAQRQPAPYTNVGHHGLAISNSSPSGSAEDLQRPGSRGRDPSPMSKRMSNFGLNVLKKRAPQQQPPLPHNAAQDANRPTTPNRGPRDVSPRSSPLRHASQPPQMPSSLGQNIDHSTADQRRPSAPFAGSYVPAEDGLMSPLPLPPRIPGGIHTRDSSRNRSSSRERPGSSAGSMGTNSLPGTPGTQSRNSLLQRPATPNEERSRTRKTFMGKLHKKDPNDPYGGRQLESVAFFVGPSGRGESYDLTPLIKGQKVPELWHPEGNLLVYLYDRAPYPSFRLDSSIIASSRGLQKLITGGSRRTKMTSATNKMRHLSLGNALSTAEGTHGRSSSTGSADTPWSPTTEDESQEMELRLPIMIDPNDPALEEVADLITARNMFACLVGQLIVGNPLMQNFFQIFMSVAGMMTRFDFSNFDGSTMGESGEAAFLGYVADLRLDDVRKSREKTIEALILGERMKCWSLYNEAYVHGVGKWNDLIEKRDPKLNSVSQRTRTAMEKSAMDLASRTAAVRERLNDFQFHGLFAGFANSKATKQAIDIQAWEASWKAMRKHVLGFYKKAYGNWPPKAKSKKNDFEESGLNRLLLQDVYRDFTDLYDMLVNRAALTERTLDSTHGDKLSEDVAMDHLRKLLSEFDRSLTPVRPPIPFDLPIVPNMASVVRGYDQMDETKQEKERSKKLKGDSLLSFLGSSYNKTSVKTTPFVEAFMAWERNTSSGRTANEVYNLRVGAWIFIYVVLQMLPLVVVDAPGLRHTRGVEYFLCEVPKGSPPWMPEQKGGMVYYRIAGTGGVVSMPADLVEHGVEGIFRRSHCWVAASKWTGENTNALLPDTLPAAAAAAAAGAQTHVSPGTYTQSAHPSGIRSVSGHTANGYGEFAPPPPMFTSDGLMPSTASGTSSPRGSRNSLMPGLEALPMPPSLGVDGVGGPRRQSVIDPTKSFDDILSGLGNSETKGKKGKK